MLVLFVVVVVKWLISIPFSFEVELATFDSILILVDVAVDSSLDVSSPSVESAELVGKWLSFSSPINECLFVFVVVVVPNKCGFW